VYRISGKEGMPFIPLHPDTKKALPLGVEMAPDGNLYVAECETFAEAMEHTSRLFRVNMKDAICIPK